MTVLVRTLPPNCLTLSLGDDLVTLQNVRHVRLVETRHAESRLAAGSASKRNGCPRFFESVGGKSWKVVESRHRRPGSPHGKEFRCRLSKCYISHFLDTNYQGMSSMETSANYMLYKDLYIYN